ncbi:MAG: hypothetical protein ACLQBX_04835, partial [Candidatus Limnocylindrales bacterium]
MPIHYLDVDDEVTTAVARLRSSAEPHVALVLPAGSRLATSRINFRLLAREAAARDLRLAIVAPEAAVRAIAIAAGVPAYATVGSYEEALADEVEQEPRDRRRTTGDVSSPSATGRQGAGDQAQGRREAGPHGDVAGDSTPGTPIAASTELGRQLADRSQRQRPERYADNGVPGRSVEETEAETAGGIESRS